MVGDTKAPFRLGEEHHAAVRGHPCAIKGGTDFLANYCW
jgi:hypothetical protein